jgi:hypothetical protein
LRGDEDGGGSGVLTSFNDVHLGAAIKRSRKVEME